MPCNALMVNPRAQINTTHSNDMSKYNWVIPCLDGIQINTNQAEAFDQTPLAKMKPPQPYQIWS